MKNTLKRRQFLGLAAAGLAMPFVGISRRALADGPDAKRPVRLFVMTDPLGWEGERSTYWCRDHLSDHELVPEDFLLYLEPMARHVDKMAVISGVNMDSRVRLGGGINHANINAHALTGSRPPHVHGSVDTAAGAYLHEYGDLPFPRLYDWIGVGPASLSYRPTGQSAGVLSTAAVYQNAFQVTPRYELLAQRALMDEVQQRLGEIRPQLVHANTSDVADAYHESVSKVADALELRAEMVCDTGEIAQKGTGNSIEPTFHLISDLFGCDLVSSVAWSEGRYPSYRNLGGYAQSLGLPTDRLRYNIHATSHTRGSVATLFGAIYHRYRFDALAALVDRLERMTDVDGNSVMDNTVIYYTSALSRNVHNTTDYAQFLLAGKNTNVKTGWNYDCRGFTNNEVLTTVMQAIGAPVVRFGGFASNGGRYNATLNNGPISKVLHTIHS